MKIDEFLSSADTVIDLRAQDKHRLLQDLCGRAAAFLNLDAEQVCREVEARESLGSTGMGNGIALPHARLDSIAKPFGIFARLKRAIEFDAIDSQPVDLVFFVLLPAAAPEDNLNTLASVARKLREPERLQRLRRATDASDLYRQMAS